MLKRDLSRRGMRCLGHEVGLVGQEESSSAIVYNASMLEMAKEPLFPTAVSRKASPFYEHSTQCNFPSTFPRICSKMYLTQGIFYNSLPITVLHYLFSLH